MAKILVVDDQAANRQLLKSVLTSTDASYEILEASSAKEAHECIKADKPDLILLDVMMPDVDGFTVCRELKEAPATRDITILFITAMEKTEDKVKGFQLGAADYITKPINNQEVRARVAAHLRIKKAEEERVQIANLEAVKNMVVTYNHNMNQPLMAALTYVELLLAKTDPADKGRSTLEKMKTELQKISAILKKIQAIEKLKRVDYVGDIKMIDLEE